VPNPFFRERMAVLLLESTDGSSLRHEEEIVRSVLMGELHTTSDNSYRPSRKNCVDFVTDDFLSQKIRDTYPAA
jgi:hypothetical protein